MEEHISRISINNVSMETCCTSEGCFFVNITSNKAKLLFEYMVFYFLLTFHSRLILDGVLSHFITENIHSTLSNELKKLINSVKSYA